MEAVRPGASKVGVLLSSGQGFAAASGVVLHRRVAGEGDLLLTLFLRGMGPTFASARGAASGRVRFGGGTEPLMWGSFTLYKGKGDAHHLKGVDVAEDFLRLRGRAPALFAAVRWAGLLKRHLLAGHPADDLLANFYWSMKLLDEGVLPVEAVEWRFLRRWLKHWGLAPEVRAPAVAGEDVLLLRSVAELRPEALTEFWTDLARKQVLPHDLRFFTDAARQLETLLNET